MGLEWEGHGIFVLVPFFVHEFIVKELSKVDGYEFQRELCKVLSKANSTSPWEWSEAVGIAFCAIRCQVQRWLRIPSVRKKLIGPLPLTWVAMQTFHVQLEFLSFHHFETSCCELLQGFVFSGRLDWSLISQSLIDDPVLVFQLGYAV